MDCIFCKIVSGEEPCHKIWEDEKHLAFLSIYPNTKGFTVVIPKIHVSSYAFAQTDEVLKDLIVATKKVALMLDKALDGVGRTGMFLEGYEIDHLHSKLSPMHGTGESSEFKHIDPTFGPFIEKYEGYLSSHDCERANDDDLAELAKFIRDKNA
ncbi:HIT family protein [Paraglaciecola sp. Hal342]|jgi:diadenosine tetraphosphate (Ap4A) HIT family hydrolase|uniref:HIT family protein n=1 Tax=Paraglaciecola chathamensis TaxID=368405 RepID=A0A8H9M2T2_9ALTE|nr:HIT family protein [Paraglaciecola oceanifecundans]GGZ84191.1 HIT family protein [Paraglaciecola oceanifecundans]|tara:strand:+ start:62 stop:523 length:462 start_codon:yes stop_codon:yes gene_type:complete